MSSSNDRGGAAREPLRALVLREGLGAEGSSYLRAEISAGGALVVSGEERAPLCEAMGEDLAEDVWLSLDAGWKDELLLHLLADRFATAAELLAYLGSHGIRATLRSA